MIGRYALLASRIRQHVAELERVVDRVERAVQARHVSDEPDLLFDAAPLNLHDFYTGLERFFTQIAANIDQSVPAGPDSHRELLRQMTVAIRDLRGQVLSARVAAEVHEFLRFRHVVRHVYALAREPDRVEHVASRLRLVLHNVSPELLAFAMWLDDLSHDTSAEPGNPMESLAEIART